ncbi:hypothetical protein B0H10DRAFT_2078797 [Mycena sp. CBHHK59/15]|nr:hypothetical protein B0H10DRAFT_2078797 [Mycena sp. CBHHK59/15]
MNENNRAKRMKILLERVNPRPPPTPNSSVRPYLIHVGAVLEEPTSTALERGDFLEEKMLYVTAGGGQVVRVDTRVRGARSRRTSGP